MKRSDDIGSWVGLMGLIFMVVVSSSCKKNEHTDLNPNLNVANDIVISQRSVLHTFRMLARAVNDPVLQQTGHDYFDGASVTYTAAANRYSFNYYGIIGPDGVLRSGTVVAELSGDFLEAETTTRFLFTNYFEDAMLVRGTDSIVSRGVTNELAVFANYMKQATILKDTAGMIVFSSFGEFIMLVNPSANMEQAWINASLTITGTSSKGYAFTCSVIEPVMYQLYSDICPWMRAGMIPFQFSGDSTLAGTIIFPPVTSCNDSVYYDFGITKYKWRMTAEYLAH